MENNEDIKIVEEKIKALNLHIDNYYKNDCETSVCKELVKERNALENLLSRLKTAEEELEKYKKIEEEIKQKANYCLEIPDEHCKKYTTAECGKCIIEWARKKVEDEV